MRRKCLLWIVALTVLINTMQPVPIIASEMDSVSGNDVIVEEEALSKTEVIDAEDPLLDQQSVGSSIGSGSCGDNISWDLTSDGTLNISGTGYYSYDSATEEPWYQFRNLIKHINIFDGITQCYFYFQDCSKLESIYYGSDVETADYYKAFEGCSSFRSISVSDQNEYYYTVDNIALFYKTSNDLVLVPKGLTEYVIPNISTGIYASAFSYCSKLRTLTLGTNTEILYQLQECENLEQIIVVDDNPEYSSDNGILYNKDKTSLIVCPRNYQQKVYTSVPALEMINYKAFYQCKNLTKVILDEGVTSIGIESFYQCEQLETIVIPSTVSQVGGEGKASFKSSFSDCPLLKTAGPTGGNYSIQYGWREEIPAFGLCCGTLEYVNISESIQRLSDRCFLGCAKLDSIDLPSDVTSIGEYAFNGCENLSAIRFHGNLPDIKDTSFYKVTATGYYPSNNGTWNSNALNGYGGTINWEEYRTELDLAALSYNFSNSRSSFGYSSSYKIPLDIYKIIFSDTRSKYLYNVQGIWGGSCYGMASSSGMMNMDGSGVTVKEFQTSATKVGDLTINDNNNKIGLTLLKFIEAMHVSQFDETVQRCCSGNTDLNSLCKAVEEGTPVIIAVFGNEGGHALVGYKLEKVNETTSRLCVYDCNYPNTERYITLSTNKEGAFTGWYYYLNNKYHWGSSYTNCRISYVPYSVYQNVWESKTSSTEQNIMTVNTNNFQIMDYSGNVVAEVNNGELSTSDSEIYQFRSLEITSDEDSSLSGNTMIYLPTDVYKIRNTDTSVEKLDVDIVNVEQSLSVSTSAANVTIAVDDSERLNTANIETEKGDTFHVNLASSLDSAKGMQEIEVSGTAAGSNITIGTMGEKCILNNCSNVDVWINGEKLGTTGGNDKISITGLNAMLEYSTCEYDGKNKEPVVTLRNGTAELNNGIDYVVLYKDNINPGNAVAEIYGINAYTGKLTLGFVIKDSHTHSFKSIVTKATISKNGKIVETCSCGATGKTTIIYYPKTVELSKTNYVYNGKARNPSIAVKGSDGKVISASNYSISYAKGRKNVGKYTVKINFKGNYSGTISRSFVITPKAASIVTLRPKSKAFTVKWKKIKQVTGYQIQYSGNKKFSHATTKTIKNNKKVSATYGKLKAKKKYYVRVRTYKAVSGKKYYSSWSKAKKVKVK